MRRRRTNRGKRRKQKNIIIVVSLSLILFLTVGYAAFSTNISLKAKGNIKDKSRILQSWEYNAQTDFHSDYYKQNIVSATFLDNADVPSNATESWNVSENKKHGGVMAWVIPNNEDNTKYDLYIGAKDGVVANEDSGYLFYRFVNLSSIEFNNNLDTSNVVNMGGMFFDCISLVNVDLSSFNTSMVTTVSGLFSMWDYQTDSKLQTINLDNWNTSQLISMRDMFAYNINLTTILGIENLDTSNVTNMHGIFYGNHSLTTLDLSKWDTEKVTNMNGLCANCYSLTELNLCNFNTKNTIDMTRMFTNTYNLQIIKVGPNWTTDQADTSDMFDGSGASEVTTGQC